MRSEIQKQWSRTLEARTKNSIAQQRPETRLAKSVSMKTCWEFDEDLRHRHYESIMTEEIITSQSNRQREARNNPEQRQKLLDGMHRPEVKEARIKRLCHEGNPRAKLTWDTVEQIRIEFSNGKTMIELMKLFPQISYATLRRVITNRTWVKP